MPMDYFLSILNLLKKLELLPEWSSPQGVFCAIAWLSTLCAGVMFVASLFADVGGGDSDVAVDDASGDSGAGWFSLRAVVGLLLGFGWGGYIAVREGMSVYAAIAVGLLLGAAMFAAIAFLMRCVYSLRSDGSLDYKTLEGLIGTVYVTIPPHGEAGGQVQVAHPSQYVTMPAVQEGDTPLPAQTSVCIVKASTTVLVVEALANHSPQKQ